MTERIEFHEAGLDRMWPECLKSLASTPSSATYHGEWGVRQPLGMYNVSLETLPRRFESVLDKLDELASKPSRTGREIPALTAQLLDAHRALLYALLEHIEDCDNIAKTFFSKSSFTGKETAFKELRAAVRPFRDPLGKIVNTMKHKQGRLGLCEAYNQMTRLFGYCVQTAIEPGVIGPDVEVHGRTGPGRLAAISFNYDLRLHYCAIYAVGEKLADFVERVRPTDAAGTLAANDRPTCPWSFNIAKRIGKLPPFVYPHETRRPGPLVSAADDAPMDGSGLPRGRLLRVGLSGDARYLTLGQIPGGAFTISMTYHGDGATTSYKVP